MAAIDNRDMAWEWVGPTTAGVVGAAGILFTWLTGKQSRDQVERMAQERLGHERTMAREAREQDRLGNAYVRLLGMAERVGQWAQMVKPMMDTVPPQPVRPLPGLDEQAEVEAVVNAFGSDAVRTALEAWRAIIKDTIATVGLIDLERDAQERNMSAETDFDPYLKLHDLRPEERQAREALARQVGLELRRAAQASASR